jgi:signal transduction histidine kinase
VSGLEVAVRAADFLRRLPLFAELEDADLERLARVTQRIDVPAGQLLMAEGTPGDGLYIVVSGELEVSKREAAADVVLAVRGPGEVLGEMSLLTSEPRMASVRALRDSELIVVAPGEFQSLLVSCPAMSLPILRTIAARLRSTESALMQREKLASLGTLAAGLAHELNNPAAALVRSTSHLETSLAELRRHAQDLAQLGLAHEDSARLQALADAAPAQARVLGALEASRREERLAEWLEARGLNDAWELAPAFVAAGQDEAALAGALAGIEPAVQPPVLRWLAADLNVRQLLGELQRSATAISAIVRAVRAWTFLDQAPLQDVDVREGLEDTLVILRHRLKDGIDIIREFDDDLPRVEAYGSELNQVWTNLIGNAIDAMGGRGTLTLRARRAGAHIIVEISDTGPGIPAGLRERVFEPFFTTKEPGQGTGLGLHVSWNIVVDRHRGRIAFEERDGRNAAVVQLPIERRR